MWIGTARIARFLFPRFIIDGQHSSERQSQWLLNEDTRLYRDIYYVIMLVLWQSMELIRNGLVVLIKDYGC